VEIFGRYQIQSELGRGAFGVVFKAHDGWDSKYVAIKVLNTTSHSNQQAVERFERECRMLTDLKHPNVVQVVEVQRVAGEIALVMELCPGSIEDAARRRVPHPAWVKLILRTAIDVGRGLAHLHSSGIVHRDVKPSNMFVPGNEVPGKIGDLGIAGAQYASGVSSGSGSACPDSRLTAAGTQPGTLVYMSPEQVRGDALDGLSDVYSLGASLYELLSAASYIPDTQTVEAVLEGILKHQPTTLLGRSLKISPEINRTVLRALAKSRRDRFGTSGELVQALETALSEYEKHGDALDLPQAPSPPRRWWQFWNRRS